MLLEADVSVNVLGVLEEVGELDKVETEKLESEGEMVLEEKVGTVLLLLEEIVVPVAVDDKVDGLELSVVSETVVVDVAISDDDKDVSI